MHDDREGVNRIAANENVHLHHGRDPVSLHVVIERRVSARYRFQAVVEIEHDLVQRQFVGKHDARLGDVLEVDLAATLVFDQLQNSPDILLVG